MGSDVEEGARRGLSCGAELSARLGSELQVSSVWLCRAEAALPGKKTILFACKYYILYTLMWATVSDN